MTTNAQTLKAKNERILRKRTFQSENEQLIGGEQKDVHKKNVQD